MVENTLLVVLGGARPSAMTRNEFESWPLPLKQ